jgi:hypothetical protein
MIHNISKIKLNKYINNNIINNCIYAKYCTLLPKPPQRPKNELFFKLLIIGFGIYLLDYFARTNKNKLNSK